MKKKTRNKSNFNIIKIMIYLIILINIFRVAPNYEINDTYVMGKINLIIDNNNITRELKKDLFINDKEVIYMSIEDIQSYFDKDVSYDKEKNQIITTYGDKNVEMPINENIMKINNRSVDILSGAIIKNNNYYVPITSMKKIYEIDIEYIQENNILLIDSLIKKLVKADISKGCGVKYKPTSFSKTVDKLQRVDKVICIENLDNNWSKIRTEKGIIGYVKTKILQNEIYLRDDLEIMKINTNLQKN